MVPVFFFFHGNSAAPCSFLRSAPATRSGSDSQATRTVPKTGLKTPFRDGLLKHVAEDVLKLAKDGLERRGYKESGFLKEVAEVVRTGVTPAEKLLDLYHGKWGCSVDPVYEELLY
ncbi:hypothetical protein MRB53_032468 [Persea americana]|uniref:Uncharacterized protein n=1 Tax=Persea americana TaxID=3435 RepID=A0ACC2KSH4_PERAE|nr:hypothetical protein MRB53_032468 [Persea americana]